MIYHQPVMVKEVLEYLNIKPDGIYVDATFGGGGHSRAIIERLKNGKCVAFDQDEDAAQNVIDDSRFVFIPKNFRHIENFLLFYKLCPVDGIVADLGVSSFQIDNPQKGFTYLDPDALLDMRMSKMNTKTAALVLNTYSKEQLKKIFFTYGDITFASRLASLIIKKREKQSFNRVQDLTALIDLCVSFKMRMNAYARVFQALRIEVNDEIGALKDFLIQSRNVLKKGGRLVVISYHSVEDRIVKHFLRTGNPEGIVQVNDFGVNASGFVVLTKKVVVPSEEEKSANPRCRSARLRAAEKL